MQTVRVDPLAYLGDEIEELREKNLYRPLRVMTGPQAVHTVVDGRPVISLSSNNYLGLTTHPRLVEAADRAVRELGVGTGAVRTIAGATQLIANTLNLLAHPAAGIDAAVTLSQAVQCFELDPTNLIAASESIRAQLGRPMGSI